MTRGRYEPTRLGFLAHLEDGRISYQEFSLHHLLRCRARESHVPGVVFTSATILSGITGHSNKQARRLLAELEDGGYIVRFMKPGQRGRYPVLIDKHEWWDPNVRQAFRVNARETTDWRDPVMEPVRQEGGEVSGEVSGDVGSEVSGPIRKHSSLSTQDLGSSTSRWSPAHDYLEDWNALAAARGWPELRALTSKRKAKLKVRESEDAWDWPAILRELERVDPGWTDGFAGWSFDWLIANDTNHVKVAEGRYRRKERREGRPRQPTPEAEPPEWADPGLWEWDEGERVCRCGYRSLTGDMLPHQCEDVSEAQEPEAVSR